MIAVAKEGGRQEWTAEGHREMEGQKRGMIPSKKLPDLPRQQIGRQLGD